MEDRSTESFRVQSIETTSSKKFSFNFVSSCSIIEPDETENNIKKEVAETVQPKVDLKEDLKQHQGSLKDVIQTNTADSIGRDRLAHGAAQAGTDSSGEVDMEASISSDDVVRAGGFGARDDIGCFLPVASDSTDFEASIRNARDYEDPQEEICRPGLGWTKATN